MLQVDVFTRLQRHIEWRARLLAEGQYDALAVTYRLPLQVRLGQLDMVVTTREDLILQIHRKRAGFLRHGFSLPRPQLLAHDLRPVRGVRRAWVRWVASKAGQDYDSRSIFGFVEDNGRFLLASVEYQTLLLPEFERRSAHRQLKFSR